MTAPIGYVDHVESRRNAKSAQNRDVGPGTVPGVAVKLVSSGVLARELGVTVRTVQHWVADGLIEPDARTAGGHARFDVARVRAELLADRPQARPRPGQG